MTGYVTIKLYGVLRKKYGDSFKCIAANVTQAMRFLDVNLVGFKDWILKSQEQGIAFRVKTNGYCLGETELNDPLPEDFTVHLIPVFIHSGGGGINWMKVILGVGLIGLGAFGVGFLGLSPLSMIVVGGLLLVSGLMGNRVPADEDDEKSLVMNGQTNTAASGGRAPIVYGKIIAGSIVLSAAVRSYITAGSAGSGGGGGGK